MGAGPEHFINNGLEKTLKAEGHEVLIESVKSKTRFQTEIQTQFGLYESLAYRVAKARQDGNFPLILSGNCGASLGAIAGTSDDRIGVIWFDAHGDFNTPETTASGFLDGMGLAIIAGLCWKQIAASIPNFKPVPGANILHVGGRDFDAKEKALFDKVGAAVVSAAAIEQANIQDALKMPLLNLQGSVESVHLHIDLDVLDPKEFPANGYAVPGGLGVDQTIEAIGLIKESVKINSVTIASFDPQYDLQGKTLQAGLKLIRKILQ